jgi:hypothetical protein
MKVLVKWKVEMQIVLGEKYYVKIWEFLRLWIKRLQGGAVGSEVEKEIIENELKIFENMKID